MIKFTDKAKSKVAEFMALQKKEGLALRIVATEDPVKGFSYQFALEEYEAERPGDQVVREGGFATRLDPGSVNILKGSTVDWLDQAAQPGFSVQNPNLPSTAGTPDDMKNRVIEALKTIFDPEIPVNIWELGLIYNIDINPERFATVKMTLTAPNCPAAEMLPAEVERKVKGVPGIKDAKIDLVWEPPWGKEMMSEAARLQLGM